MKVDFRRDIHRQYMIMRPDGEQPGNSFRLKMIIDNVIPGFAPCTYESMNGVPMLYYDVTGMQPLNVYFNKMKTDRAFFNRLISSLLTALDTIGKYLIETEYLVIRPETIFVNLKSGEITYVCFPFEKNDINEQMKAIAGFLISRSSEEADDIRAAYHFYQACSSSDLTAETLMEVLRNLHEPVPEERNEMRYSDNGTEMMRFAEDTAVYNEQKNGRKGKKTDKEKTGYKAREKSKEKSRTKPKEKTKGSSILQKIRESVKGTQKERKEPIHEKGRDGWEEYRKPVFERNVINESGKDRNITLDETICLSRFEGTGNKTPYAWLVPADVFSGESIDLTKDECIIGRGAGPGIISIGVKEISRKHARLVRSGITYAVSDLGSRNGTFVNGEVLAAGENKELTNGDILKFANVEYYFHLA